MKKLMHILFLSCLKATELMEKRFHFGLSWHEKIQLKLHKSMCKACSTYDKQSDIIEHALKEMLTNNEITVDFDKLKQQINAKLTKSI
jgi:hypothetical protein